ncbi:MAG: MFS transporter, partial [SAR324 cluster bacterium]|nr:MFS transporter [SAR324 cluster bacterium]
SLCSDERGNMTNNLSFVLLFQSIAFLVGPIVSGSIAENVGLFEIYLFSSLMAFLIVFFSFAYGRIKPP